MLKRYMVFFAETYYPKGGMGDFRADFDELDEASHYIVSEVAEDVKRGGYIRDGVFSVYDQETRAEVIRLRRNV